MNKWKEKDIELFWRMYSKNGRLTDEGFELLKNVFFCNKEEGWHMRVLKERVCIQNKIFSMIFSHPSGEKFVKEFFNNLGGATWQTRRC